METRSPLCFSCNALIFGCRACMARCDLICLTKTGNRMARMVSTRKMMARIHDQSVRRTLPTWSRSQTACQNSRIWEMIV